MKAWLLKNMYWIFVGSGLAIGLVTFVLAFSLDLQLGKL